MKINVILTITVLFTCCSQPGPGVQVERIDQVALLDVQALHGGLNLWIAADGKATCSFVTPPGPETRGATGFQESRYEATLSSEQRARLLGLVNQHQLFSIETKNRPGVPDEARPVIYVEAGNSSRAVAKWANDTHADFDPIYRFLREACESLKAGAPVYAGAYRQWAPAGFPAAGTLIERTLPKLD